MPTSGPEYICIPPSKVVLPPFSQEKREWSSVRLENSRSSVALGTQVAGCREGHAVQVVQVSLDGPRNREVRIPKGGVHVLEGYGIVFDIEFAAVEHQRGGQVARMDRQAVRGPFRIQRPVFAVSGRPPELEPVQEKYSLEGRFPQHFLPVLVSPQQRFDQSGGKGRVAGAPQFERLVSLPHVDDVERGGVRLTGPYMERAGGQLRPVEQEGGALYVQGFREVLVASRELEGAGFDPEIGRASCRERV
jgi:hypothetical protein